MVKRDPSKYEIRSGIPIPPKNDGRPRDPRIADICNRAATGIACGQFADARDAANAFVPEYKGNAYDPSDRIAHNEAANDLRKAIERHNAEATRRSL